jgi:hypothetical protein
MAVMLVCLADWLTCEVPYEADANASRAPHRGLHTCSSPATSLVHVAVFTNIKVVANVKPSISVHVEVLVRTHYASALGLGRAESVGAPVVYYDDGRRRSQCGGCATRLSCAPPCSGDNIGTCCWKKRSLLIYMNCVPCIVVRFIWHNAVLHHLTLWPWKWTFK